MRLQTDEPAAQIYRKAVRLDEIKKQDLLSEEHKQQILSGGTRYKVKEAEIAFFTGVAKNKRSNIIVVLAEEGIHHGVYLTSASLKKKVLWKLSTTKMTVRRWGKV